MIREKWRKLSVEVVRRKLDKRQFSHLNRLYICWCRLTMEVLDRFLSRLRRWHFVLEWSLYRACFPTRHWAMKLQPEMWKNKKMTWVNWYEDWRQYQLWIDMHDVKRKEKYQKKQRSFFICFWRDKKSLIAHNKNTPRVFFVEHCPSFCSDDVGSCWFWYWSLVIRAVKVFPWI